MINPIRSWTLTVAWPMAALAFTACSGNGAGFFSSGAQLRTIATPEGTPARACSKRYTACYTVSRKNGKVLDWCDGTYSNPCGDTNQFTWSGNVCVHKSTTCGPIKRMTAAWTGPFPCQPSICHGSSKGYYEVDTISIGSPPPRKTRKFLYKQAIVLNGSVAAYIGLNVGP